MDYVRERAGIHYHYDKIITLIKVRGSDWQKAAGPLGRGANRIIKKQKAAEQSFDGFVLFPDVSPLRYFLF